MKVGPFEKEVEDGFSYLCPPNKVWETYSVCSVSYYSYYYSSSFFLSSVKSLYDTFLGDALIKLYETL